MFPKFIAISSIMVALQAEHHLNRRSSFTGNSIMQYYSSQNCKKSENWQLIKLQTIRISWKCKITFLNGISMFSKLCLYVYLEIIQKLGKISKYHLCGNTCSPAQILLTHHLQIGSNLLAPSPLRQSSLCLWRWQRFHCQGKFQTFLFS